MPKRPLRIPDRSEITDDTPLHLETAARLSSPDGSVSALALRNAAARGELEHVQIGGRILTTLAWVKDFMELCRRPAHARPNSMQARSKDEAYRSAALANAYRVVADLRAKAKEDTPSEAHRAVSAALEARRRALSKPKPDKGGEAKGGQGRRPKE